MRRWPLLVGLALALAACGASRGLKPRAGETLPVPPYGAHATPTPDQLVTPTVQQRPRRDDSLLQSAGARPDDQFDLPPKR